MLVPDLIYDIGLHVGNDTAYYMSEGYRVIAVEANPMLVEQCKKRFARELQNGLLRILPIGIGPAEGMMPFYVNPRNTEWSAFDKEVAWRDGQDGPVVDVPVMRLTELFKHYGVPYFLKSDIETGDRFVLDALETLDRKDLPIYMSIEAHKLEYLARLNVMGYTAFKVVDQKAHGMHACSGPFGEKAPGRWVAFDVAAYEWLHSIMGHRERHTWLTNDPKTWHDFHVKRTW
ncbi:MAG TPA: FkbM family methyltransferase [Candidatus Baltobacteraceae bacterium]|nr:FkbM family methyltransferase [Candidatus Baltobacteraceae bacterium]